MAIKAADSSKVTVSPGAAIDDLGRQIVLAAEQSLAPTVMDQQGVKLVILYHEEESDPAPGGGENTRLHETAEFQFTTAEVAHSIPLALLDVGADGTVGGVDDSVRVCTGVGANLQVEGDLTVKGTGVSSFAGNVGIGTADPDGHKLKVVGGSVCLEGLQAQSLVLADGESVNKFISSVTVDDIHSAKAVPTMEAISNWMGLFFYKYCFHISTKVIIDLSTGLMWPRNPKLLYDPAADPPTRIRGNLLEDDEAAMTLLSEQTGYRDWRLPHWEEMLSFLQMLGDPRSSPLSSWSVGLRFRLEEYERDCAVSTDSSVSFGDLHPEMEAWIWPVRRVVPGEIAPWELEWTPKGSA